MSKLTVPSESDLSVQLEALADEVFEAAAAQARMGAQSRRFPYGEAIWNPDYPDLYFLNGIVGLVAPGWSVEEFERTVMEIMPDVRRFRAYTRDSHTVAGLGARLTRAGYAHEVRLGMVQISYSPSPLVAEDRVGGFRAVSVGDPNSWSDYEESIWIDGQEHGWTTSMTEQFIALCHRSAAETPTRYFLAYEAGRPVAHVGLFQHRTTAYLHALYTHPPARRRGAGSALTIAMNEKAHAMGCDRLTLQCTDDGYLPRFYSRLGFRAVGELHIWTKQL